MPVKKNAGSIDKVPAHTDTDAKNHSGHGYCPKCGSGWVVKHGLTTNKGNEKQRYLCKSCGRKTSAPLETPHTTAEMAERGLPKINLDTWFAEKLRSLMTLSQPPASLPALLQSLVSALPKDLQDKKDLVTQKKIFDAFDDLFWKPHKDILRHLERARYTKDELKKLLVDNQHRGEMLPPDWVIQWRINEMYGWTEAPRKAPKVLRGMHQVDFLTAEKREMPETSFKAPFHALPDNENAKLRVAWISAPKLGRVYNKNIHKNEIRSALSASRKIHCDAIVIGGGLFHMLLQKTAGPQRLLYDLANGLELDIESINERHRKVWDEVRKAGSLKPLWRTTAEEYGEAWRGWYKVAHRPNQNKQSKLPGPPEFRDPVYIVFNNDDLEIVRKIVYAYLRYNSILEQSKARSVKNITAKLAAKAKVELNNAMRSGNKKWIKEAREALEIADQTAAEAAEDEIRYIVSNTDSTQNLLISAQGLSSFVGEIEKAIPNSKVIGQNTAYMRFGGNAGVVKVVSAGSNSGSPWDFEVGTYGESQRSLTQAALTMIMHPCAITPRMTPRENYKEGTMNVQPVMFVECPTIIDPVPIRERLHGAKVNLPFLKAVNDPRFEAGMTIVDFYPDRPPEPWFLRLEAVRHFGAQEDKVIKRPAPKYVYIALKSDSHVGGKMRLPLWLPTGFPMGITEALLYLMRPYVEKNNGRAPVSGFWAADDSCQGNHIEGQNRIHPQSIPLATITEHGNKWMERIKSLEDPAAREAEYQKLSRWQAFQMRFRQPDHEGSQLQEFKRGVILPNRRVFKGIVLKAHDSGLITKTMSDVTGQPDTRNIGIVNLATGNHLSNGVHNRILEGDELRDYVQALLWDDPDLKRLGINVERAVCAPREQTRTTGYGTVQIGPNGFPYGICMLNAPPARNSWNDPLQAWVKANLRRGNPSTILEGKFVIYITGDKHFLVVELASGAMWVMCPPDTHTDEYANIAGGLPENNAGVAFLRLSVNGPDEAGLGVVFMTPSTMQEYLTSGEDFPWDEFLPNAL